MMDNGNIDQVNEESYEQHHVHNVYNSIASHFSQTRYKPWPIVERFIKDLPPGSIGVDIGCGNGKYLGVRDDIYILGSDRSDELVNIAKQHKRHDTLVGDALTPPHPEGRFDFAISIAVLHHLSTRERRVEGVQALLRTLRYNDSRSSTNESPERDQFTDQNSSTQHVTNSAQALIFVWALEQKDSRRGWDEGGKQDILVPWVLKAAKESSRQSNKDQNVNKGRRKQKQTLGISKSTSTDSEEPKTLENNPSQEKPTYDHNNGPSPDATHNTREGDVKEDDQSNGASKEQVYQRYYHLYRKGELEEDVIAAGGEVIAHGYERDNWWCIASRKSK